MTKYFRRVVQYVLLCAFILTHSSTSAQQSSDGSHALHVRAHQNKYVPGDTVFLKAYFLDKNGKGVTGKHLITVSLVDNKGIVVQTARFSMLAGIGYNQLRLPDSLQEGFYNLIGVIGGVEGASSIYTSQSLISVLLENTIIPDGTKGALQTFSSASQTDANTTQGKALISIPEDSVRRRQLVNSVVQVHDESGKPMSAEFSLKVYNKIVTGSDTLSELRERMFSNERSPALNATSPVVQNASNEILNVFQKTGKVYSLKSGQVVPDNTHVMFYLQHSQWYHQTFTLNKGSVRLNLPQFYGDDELFYLAESERGQVVPIRIEWETSEQQKFLPAPMHSIGSSPDAYANFKKKQQIIERSYKAFAGSETKFAAIDIEFDLVEPDNVIKPDQFVRFENLAEMIREVVPALYHRSHGGEDVVRLNLPDPLTATSDPVYIIDGKATSNTGYFLSIPPAEIEYLALVKDPKKLLPLRLLGKNGIVIVKSKSGKWAPPTVVANVLQGLNSPIHISKAPSGHDTVTPIFRSTLYWQPTVTTDKAGKASVSFYTTDDIGEMIIEIEGLTSDGHRVFSQRKIWVR